MNDLSKMTLRRLLGLHAGIMEELRRRGVARNENNPTANLAEFLFCRAYAWQKAPNSEKGFSASDCGSLRYRIKGRRLHRRNESRQLSAIRDLDGFDTLAAVLLDNEYRVLRAALIPGAIVRERCKFDRHTNSYNFMLTDDIWDDVRVMDATMKLRTVESES
ncbi:MAG: hypothetical protein OXI22_04190 [Defluviicoccus sp.]|nr:hypothetical protein [Defluviicoccus sp.]MDE0383062.1 hypothetical protein [Defluviicoccus sp.]